MTPKFSSKELVSLRKKPTNNGGYSLYLDYTIDGVRRKEYLKMYLVPERNESDRAQNRETLRQAQGMKAKRTTDIMSGETGFLAKRDETPDIRLSDYVERRIRFYMENGQEGAAESIRSLLTHLRSFRDVTLRSVDSEWLAGFLRHLRNSGIAQGSQALYYGHLRSILNSARREGLTDSNPMERVDPKLIPTAPESVREHLTLDEVRALASTPMRGRKWPDLKPAFLFACFTGLRISDVKALTWGRIVTSGEGKRQIEMRQKKTGGLVYIPLSSNAQAWLPSVTGGKDEHVFALPENTSSSQIGRLLSRWCEDAGVKKKVTFHVSRHTFATLLLEYGTDIYTVSSLLGHSSVATTQIYAKVVDKKKREATDSIPEL